MILDSLLFSNINVIGKALLNEAGLKNTPQNIYEMKIFLETNSKCDLNFCFSLFQKFLFDNLFPNFLYSILQT